MQRIDKIALKSTSSLMDEYLTTTIKVENNIPESEKRQAELEAYLMKWYDRVRLSIADTRKLESLLNDLETVLRDCWNAQEIVMGVHDDKTIALAAKSAQKLNGERTMIMREIDILVGDKPPLEKSYVLRPR